MRKNASKTSSRRYPELHKYEGRPYWVFRKYSKTKRKEFVATTGIEARESAAPEAYKRGRELFDEWLGNYLPSGRPILIRDIARSLVAAKETKKKNTYKSFKNQVENHIIPAFGHLRPDQVTVGMWKRYDEEQRRKGDRTRLFNTLKALREILNRAKDDKILKFVPRLKNTDSPPQPPRRIPRKTYLKIRRELHWKVRWLAFLMYEQGGRPTEVMQYCFSMIDWQDGPTGTIAIPAEITKTNRFRKIPLSSRVSRALFWLRSKSKGDCVLPSRSDPNRPLSAYNAVWDRTMAKLKLSYTIYNLRDSFITNKLEMGLSSTFIGKYCDTSSEMIDRKYAVAEDSILQKVAG